MTGRRSPAREGRRAETTIVVEKKRHLFVKGTNFAINLGHYSNITHGRNRRIEPMESRGPATRALPNMLSLYQSFIRMDSFGGIELEPTLPPMPSSRQADIIRSLVPKSVEKVSRRWIVVFDFSSLTQEEEIKLAELRFEFPVLRHNRMEMTVDIFHQKESTCQEGSRDCMKYFHLGSLACTGLSKSSEGWVKVDTTEIVHDWIKMNETEKKLKEAKKLPRADKTGRQGRKSNDQQVLMFIYSNLSTKEKKGVSATLLHDALHSKYLTRMPVAPESNTMKRHRRSQIIKDRMLSMKHVQPELNNSTLCRRVDFFVDFSLIGWDKYIIHPIRYNAYRCEGICPSPVSESLRPNNHAYLQSVLHYYTSSKAPPVCCVPVKMSALSMIHRENGGITKENHEAMIVDECGCQ
ncbi:nodal homolog [Discoglossus pictus]